VVVMLPAVTDGEADAVLVLVMDLEELLES
jgi:hypothetical protein